MSGATPFVQFFVGEVISQPRYVLVSSREDRHCQDGRTRGLQLTFSRHKRNR